MAVAGDPGQALIRDLARAGVPASANPEHRARAGTDWTGMHHGPVLAVARPTRAAQVSAALRVAGQAAVPVQIQGGNTGLVGGSVPSAGHPAMILSTLGLADLGAVDRQRRAVRAGAGVTCATVAAAAATAGLRFGVDLAARDSATIGGMVATNAGGIHVCAYGMMRRQVLGVVAVLADGGVVDTTGRPLKDNTGYDLTGLLVGSEGTLGVVVAAELALHPEPPATSVALLPVPDLATAVGHARAVGATGHRLLAAEAVDDAGMSRVARTFDLRLPRTGAERQGWWLLVEVADGATGSGLEPMAAADPAVALTSTDRAEIWALRERQTLAYSAIGQPMAKFDVAVLPDLLDSLTAGVTARLAEIPGVAGHGFFGHVLDGNLHIEVWGPDAAGPPVAAAVLGEVGALGGSISAEHGVGRVKAEYLHLSRSAAEIAAMSAVRAALDPAGLLNPGVLLPRRS